MTYHLYARPDGFADITTTKLVDGAFPGYLYLGEYKQRPPVDMMAYDRSKKEWKYAGDIESLRYREYPTPHEQLAMIWKALNEVKGKPFSKEVQAMIDKMAAVDAKYPKTTS